MCSLSSDKVMGLEVVWTPDQAYDYLPLERMCCDYPEMVKLSTGELATCKLPSPAERAARQAEAMSRESA